MKKELDGKYAIVTVAATFRQRYVVPTEELQQLNQDIDLNEAYALEWVEECVHAEEVKEFSQKFLGEQVVDKEIIDQSRLLEIFDRENEYLSTWDEEKKLNFINDWKEKQRSIK